MFDIEEEDKKAILLTMIKKSYRNGTLKFKLEHRSFDGQYLGNSNHLGECRDFTILHGALNDLCISTVAYDGVYYHMDIIDLKTNEAPRCKFKILVTAYLFDNEMQYFSLPLNFRGRRK